MNFSKVSKLRPSKFLLLALLCLLINYASSAPSKNGDSYKTFEDDEERYRLSKYIIPHSYDLTMRMVLDPDPDFGRFTAPGEVTIGIEVHVDVPEPPTSIRLHSTTIDVKDAGITLKTVAGTTIGIVGTEVDVEAETITILVETPLRSGLYKLFIPFVAQIHNGKDTQFGLYRSSYINSDGGLRFLAVTNFETAYARKMVPCFDEPAMKAIWTVTVIRQSPYHSLSNNDLKETIKLDENWYQDVYTTTGLMNTYNLAIAVSDYASQNATQGIWTKPVTIWAPANLIEAPNDGGKFAADLTAKAFAFLDQNLGVPYPFPKMDKFGVNDFFAGAQENSGLNTYRSSRLIYIEGESTIQDKVTMANTVAHELAHQWFGNLVTMAWWSDTWLNEGFATYFANVVASAPGVYPEYGWEDFVVVDSVQDAFQADVRGTTYPLHNVGLLKPNETSAGFNTISYEKGGSIVRMMNQFLTKTLFMEGIVAYLKKFQSGNAEQDNLFESLGGIAGVAVRLPATKTFKNVLDTWTLQSGYPVVRVSRNDGTANIITLQQEIFLNDTRKYQPGEQKWYIPITYQTTSMQYDPNKIPEWFLNNETSTELTGISPDTSEFVVINPEQTGFYRVLYDDVSYQRLRDQLNNDHEKLNFKTRSGILDDYFIFGFNGYIPLANAMDLTKYLSKEKNLTPWATFVNNMALANKLLQTSGTYYYFRKYCRNIMAPVLQAIQVAPSPSDDVFNVMLLRNRLVEWTCTLGLQECVDFAKSEVSKWIGDPSIKPLSIQPDLRPAVYCTAVANADDENQVFDFIFQRYLMATNGVEQQTLLKALTCSTNPAKLNNLIDLALQGSSQIRENDRLTVLQLVTAQSLGLHLVFDILRTRSDSIIASFGISAISKILSTMSAYVAFDVDIKDIRRFIDANREAFAPIREDLNSSLATMENNNEWIRNNYDSLGIWLRSNA